MGTIIITTYTFELNGKNYKTNKEAFDLLKKYRESAEVFGWVFSLGKLTGTITEIV